MNSDPPATRAVLLPGLESTGTPASQAHAAFSIISGGEVERVDVDREAGRGTRTWRPQKRGVRPSWTPSPSTR